MAYDILNHCRKQPWNINVTRVDDLGKHTAGQYRHTGENGQIMIRVGDDASPNIILSVLIHECMHHFLITSGIGFKDSHKNEVLTDTAALYLGFSEYMNKGQIGVGYLSYSELLYVEKLIRSKGSGGWKKNCERCGLVYHPQVHGHVLGGHPHSVCHHRHF